MTRQKGVIKFTNIGKEGTLYGYITLDEKVHDYDGDVIFFENNLKEIDFSSLEKDMKVEFLMEPYKEIYKAYDITAVPNQISKPIIKSKSVALNRHFQNDNSLKKLLPKIDKKPSNQVFLEKLEDAYSSVEQISDPNEFEDAVFSLLRLLGIHSVYQYPREEQAGRADGCFVLGNLVVMYDCTLRTYFEEFKEEQIDNYVNKLSNKSQLTVKIKKIDGGVGSKELQIKGKQRQVWIVTKGKTREIKDYDGIRVKEISIADLINVSIKRCKQLNYSEDILSSELFMLGM